MENQRLLEIRNLSISFGGLQAVSRVDFHVDRGEIVGLIGPNGSGKTTFFNLVSGIYKPHQGEIWFKKESIVGQKPHQITRRGMARTFQNSRLFWQLTILDNVILGMYAKQRATLLDIVFRNRRSKAELRQCSQEALRVLGYFSPELCDNHSRYVVDLPQGDRRRVEICRALASRPDLILLDEPSAGMSTEETEKLMEDIGKVKQQHKDIGIVIIEHDMKVIEKIAQRVIVFNYGRKIAEGPFSEIATNSEVLEAYLGDEKE